MSLITQASTFNSETFTTGKRQARMKNTFENIKKEQKQYQEPMSNDFDLKKENDSRNEHINNLINKRQPEGENDGSNLYEFNPIPKDSRVVPQMPSLNKAPNFPANTSENVSVSREPFMNPASFHKTRGSSYSQSYAPTPYYKGLGTTSSQTSGNSMISPSQPTQLMEKLNYMIHLLEEQQKEPTQNIMEEFVLYGLLGVFMIYIVDSFARAGKYIR